MATYRVGIVSDTHVPEFVSELHQSLFKRLRGVDLLLHAGDITEPSTLAALEQIAPVLAVRGNHDDFDLPLQRVIDAAGVKIGLIHGHRGRTREFPGVAWNEAFAGRRFFFWNGIRRHVTNAFPEPVDVVVFGHIHRALVERRTWGGSWVNAIPGEDVDLGDRPVGPVLRLCPGATYFCTADEARRRLAKGGRPLHRLYYRSRARWDPGTPTVALLTIRGRKVAPEILPLEG